MTDKDNAKQLADKLTEALKARFEMPDLNIAYAGSPLMYHFRLQFTNEIPNDIVMEAAKAIMAELTQHPVDIRILGVIMAHGY